MNQEGGMVPSEAYCSYEGEGSFKLGSEFMYKVKVVLV